MKTLKNYFLYSLLLFVTAMPGCQQDELDTMRIQPSRLGPGYKAPNPGGTRIEPPQVIKEEFAHATGWRIIWEDTGFENETWQKYPGIFSTVNGSVHSINYLNNTSWQNTDNADMYLLFEQVTATTRPELTHQAHVKATEFKRSDMTVQQLADYAENDPDMFQYLFENEAYGVAEKQPIVEESNYSYYQPGDIYTFKTDRVPAKYGAIRIVELWSPSIIEVVVQKDGIGGLTN